MEANQSKKSEIISKFGKKTSDTGSAEVQVAFLTQRINELNGHMQKFAKDFSAQRGLLKLVGQRKRLLAYLRQANQDGYTKLIQSLNLRK